MRLRKGRNLGAMTVAVLVGVTAVFGLRFNTSASLPRGLYLSVGWFGRAPARGDLVLGCAPPAAAELALRRGYLRPGRCAAGYLGGAGPLGKVVLAVAGDEVAVEASGLRVNGVAVERSQARSRDTAGRLLEGFPAGRYRVAAGEVWLFAPYDLRSYDSRYFGPVSESSLSHMVPLLIAPDNRWAAYRVRPFEGSVGG